MAATIASELRFVGLRRRNALFSLKMKNDVREMLFYLQHSLRQRDILESFHGKAFPLKIEELFSVNAYGRPAGIHSELIWGLFRASLYRIELTAFSVMREDFERAVLLDRRIEAKTILDEIEQKFGVSIWLIQNRLSIAQVWDGLEEKRRLASDYITKTSGNPATKLLISFIAKRSEATGLKNHLQEELDRFLDVPGNSHFQSYIRTKLFELGQYTTSNIATTLLFDAQSSLVDHYETLVLVLQAVVVDNNLPKDVAQSLCHFLKTNHGLVDSRLRSAERTLNPNYIPGLNDMELTRTRIIEAYSSGIYQEVTTQAADYLLQNPHDISICALMAKASLATGSEISPLPGYIGELARLFCKLLELGKETYGAAFAIYTIHERFYGHPWAVMAMAIMNDVLARETVDYPSLPYKYILSIDRYVSPFTALALPQTSRDGFRSSELLRKFYPCTSNVLSSLIDGKSSIIGDSARLEKYQARHNLTAGNYKIAAEQFAKLMTIGALAERFRAAACAAQSYLLLGDLAKSVDAVVHGALINREVPIILPIPEVVANLDTVSTWPYSISLPILFELYSAYFSDDKATHLNFAFERFQLEHSINQPEDLVKRIDEYGRDEVIIYLDRVWRPEVMRQTLLYETPKETEDARIAVCRVLASIDPGNLHRYQEEIRDRVKRQEIAKGTTLLEQSKVYVDISAIKKTLNAKLGDTYTRYKNATQINPNKQDKVMEELADLVSDKFSKDNISLTNILSSLHVMDYQESELDLQFSALFAEVTNEFLKGDHGLNAYLSTRVRHGTLANTLRKPLADEHLVTALKEDESGYLPNTSWDDDLDSLQDSEKDHVTRALEKFTTTFDKIIDHVKNNLIQIKVFHNIVGTAEDVDALFVYRSSNLERKYIQEYDKKVTSIEQFIDRCIESLWEKTDSNLAAVRTTLRDKTRSDFLDCFDRLSEQINLVSNPYCVSGLINAIARARTNFQTKFHVVQSWFNRSEVYDRQDYNPEYAVQIALNMVQKTIPNGYHDLDVDISMDCAGATMPGRTLDAMVDVFACLLENATIRSGLTTERLRIKVELALCDGKFSATVWNNIAPDKPTAIDIDKIQRVRESLQKSDSRARAQREGGSGLHKIWRAITSPIYKDPYFVFGYEDSKEFRVNIKYNLDQSENENTVN
ncbi:MAG: hypothetical protein Q7R66_13415 [Undibacterium sp.]|nr:hypothetical protein [Undibacterium sp.]